MKSTTVTPFCSRVARAAGFQPIGTAPTYRAHLVLECALPWEREVTDSATFPAEVAKVLARAADEGIEPRITGPYARCRTFPTGTDPGSFPTRT